MKTIERIILILALALSSLYQNSFSQSWEWFETAEIPDDFFAGLCIDSSGNRYIAGRVIDSLAISSTTIQTDSIKGAGYIVKLDTGGLVAWYNLLETSDFISIGKIITSRSGCCYIAGYFKGSIVIDNTIYNAPTHSGFIAKINQDGSHAWFKHFGGSTAGYSQLFSISMDNNENIYGCGVWDSLSVGSVQHYGAFLVKMDSSGTEQWSKRNPLYRTSMTNCNYCFRYLDVSVDNFNLVYVSGGIGLSSGDYGIIESDTVFQNTSFIVRYDGNGNFRSLDTTGTIDPLELLNLPNGTLVTQVFFRGAIEISGNIYYSMGTGHDEAILYSDSSGNDLGGFVIAGPASEGTIGIDIDYYGNILLAGHYRDTITMDNHQFLPYDTSIIDSDIFLFNIDPQTNHLNWYYTFGGKGDDYPTSVSSFDSSSIYISGGFLSDSCDFGSFIQPNSSSWSIFLGKIQVPNIISNIKETENKNFEIFPVPATSMLRVNLTGLQNKSNSISIRTVFGQQVLSTSISESTIRELNLEQLMPGTYIIEVAADNKIFRKKFIKINP